MRKYSCLMRHHALTMTIGLDQPSSHVFPWRDLRRRAVLWRLHRVEENQVQGGRILRRRG
jgi:hypothetical protein